jgi:hypothetical protein
MTMKGRMLKVCASLIIGGANIRLWQTSGKQVSRAATAISRQ